MVIPPLIRSRLPLEQMSSIWCDDNGKERVGDGHFVYDGEIGQTLRSLSVWSWAPSCGFMGRKVIRPPGPRKQAWERLTYLLLSLDTHTYLGLCSLQGLTLPCELGCVYFFLLTVRTHYPAFDQLSGPKVRGHLAKNVCFYSLLDGRWFPALNSGRTQGISRIKQTQPGSQSDDCPDRCLDMIQIQIMLGWKFMYLIWVRGMSFFSSDSVQSIEIISVHVLGSLLFLIALPGPTQALLNLILQEIFSSYVCRRLPSPERKRLSWACRAVLDEAA